MQHDAALDEDAAETRAHDGRMLRNDAWLIDDQCKLRRARVQRRLHPMLHGQAYLHAIGAAAAAADGPDRCTRNGSSRCDSLAYGAVRDSMGSRSDPTPPVADRDGVELHRYIGD